MFSVSDFRPETWGELVLTGLLVVAIAVTAAGVGFALVVPKDDDPYTEFYLASIDESGDSAVSNPQTAFASGEIEPVRLGITNREDRRLRYVVVVERHRTVARNNATDARTEREVARLRTTVEPGETRVLNWTNDTPITGDGVRLVFLLYRGTAPEDPTWSNAYRHLRLRIDGSDEPAVRRPKVAEKPFARQVTKSESRPVRNRRGTGLVPSDNLSRPE